MVRNDPLARTWFKKDDTFWVPKANLIVSCKSPIIYASAENSVKARLFTDLIRDALEEYSYDAELAGLQYTISLDSRGLFIEISGTTISCPFCSSRFSSPCEISKFATTVSKSSRSASAEDTEISGASATLYPDWRTTRHGCTAEHDFVIEERAAELPAISAGHIRDLQEGAAVAAPYGGLRPRQPLQGGCPEAHSHVRVHLEAPRAPACPLAGAAFLAIPAGSELPLQEER